MEYDPVKDRLQALVGKHRWARRLFFSILDRLFLRSRYVRREIERLRGTGFKPERVLDAGSGFGQYSFRMAKAFPQAKIIGLDLKEDLVQSCNDFWLRYGSAESERVQFAVGDLMELPCDSQFDLILSVDVMEHIAEDELVFQNIGRALRPGGIFIMTTPYYDVRGWSRRSGQPFVDEHVRPGYSRSELEAKLAQAQMVTDKFIITYGLFGRVAWTLLQKWPMSWLSKAKWLVPLVAIYLLPVYPLAWLFMRLDMTVQNRMGGGILAVAVKTGDGERKKPIPSSA